MVYNNKKDRFGFTLVELIIVITILTILAIIAFISFKNYTNTARDSNRVTTIRSIETGVELFMVKTGSYPSVENPTYGKIGSSDILEVGIIDEQIVRNINMNDIPLDPKTKNNYFYGTSIDKQNYQIAATLENLQTNTFMSTAYADKNQAKVVGNYQYPLKMGGKICSLPSLIFLGDENLDNNSKFIVDKGGNLPYALEGNMENQENVLTQLQKFTQTGSNSLELVCIDISSITDNETLENSKNIVDEIKQKIGLEEDKIGEIILGEKYEPKIEMNCAEKESKYYLDNKQECDINLGVWEEYAQRNNLVYDAKWDSIDWRGSIFVENDFPNVPYPNLTPSSIKIKTNHRLYGTQYELTNQFSKIVTIDNFEISDILFLVKKIDLSNLEKVRGTLSFYNSRGIEEFNIPKLKYVGGNILLSLQNTNASFVGGMIIPNLEYVGGGIYFRNQSKVSQISFPKLKYMGGTLELDTNTGLEKVDFGNLEHIGGTLTINYSSNIDWNNGFGKLKMIGGSFINNGGIDNNTTSMSTFSQLESIGGDFDLRGKGKLLDISAFAHLSNIGGSIIFPKKIYEKLGSDTLFCLNILSTKFSSHYATKTDVCE